MFRSIVVAHDGTESGDRAVELALQLRAPDGELVLVLVEPRPLHGDALLEGAALAIPEDVPHRTERLVDSSATRALTQWAEVEDADLLVVGPSHRTRFGRSLHNTTGQRLLHGAPCAVAVATRHSAPIRRIAVAYDGSAEAELALETAAGLARDLDAEIILFEAVEPVLLVEGGVAVPAHPELDETEHRLAEERLEAAAAALPELTVRTEVLLGRAATLLPGVLAREADLVLTGSRGYGALRRVFLGSVSTALAGNGAVPVLITPRGAAIRHGGEAVARDMGTVKP